MIRCINLSTLSTLSGQKWTKWTERLHKYVSTTTCIYVCKVVDKVGNSNVSGEIKWTHGGAWSW